MRWAATRLRPNDKSYTLGESLVAPVLTRAKKPPRYGAGEASGLPFSTT
jgi:hypothetical protein